MTAEVSVEVGKHTTRMTVSEFMGGQWCQLWTEVLPTVSPATILLLLEHAGWHLADDICPLDTGWWAPVTTVIEDSIFQRKVD